MRIGVNAVPLRVNSGGARYVFAALFTQLLKLDQEHAYVVFAHPAGVPLVREIVDGADNSCVAGAKPLDRVRIIAVIDEELIYPHRGEFDLYFNPMNSLKPRILDRPTVLILHDIQEQYFPRYFTYADLMARYEVYPEFCRAATTVVTVSEFCKRCIVEKFGVDPQKIEVIHNAPQAELAGANPADGGSWAGPELPRPFFFYPANNYHHKNHALLLDAMQRFGATGPHAVFTGQQMPGGYPLAAEIKSRNLEGNCRISDHLTASEMRYLYRNAAAVVMPTMFEGFGMPAIEALACGCPLVCSDIPALREVAGENALYFPPDELDGLCDRLRQILSDPDSGRGLIDGGKEIAKRFTWESAGRRMLDVFAAAESRFRFGYEGKSPAARRRPKIGILISGGVRDAAIARTVQSLIEASYENLAIGFSGTAFDTPRANIETIRDIDAGEGELAALSEFARRGNLDLVGQIIAGNTIRPSGLDSLALSFIEAGARAVHLGEAVVWRADRYQGVARLRYTGDQMWRIENLLFPEMFFLAPAALANWPAGQSAMKNAGEQWRWYLLLAARVDDQLAIVRRTLADCDRSSLGRFAWFKAARAGMLEFHQLDNRPTPVPLLRRFERRLRILSQLLPLSLQHQGTKWWYRLSRSQPLAPVTNESAVSPPPAPLP